MYETEGTTGTIRIAKPILKINEIFLILSHSYPNLYIQLHLASVKSIPLYLVSVPIRVVLGTHGCKKLSPILKINKIFLVLGGYDPILYTILQLSGLKVSACYLK